MLPTVYIVFPFSGVYNEATNEIVTGGVGNVTVSTAQRQCIFRLAILTNVGVTE